MMLIRLSRRWSERSDGAIQSKRRPQDPVQSLRGRDFRFRPDTGVFETVAGRSQFGLAGDDWGNRFLSWNTIPIRHEVIPDAFLSRSTLLQDFLDPNRQIAPDYAAYEIIPKTGEPAVGLIASETIHLHLAGQRASRWPLPEGFTLNLPVTVGLALEVGDNDVGALGWLREQAGGGGER